MQQGSLDGILKKVFCIGMPSNLMRRTTSPVSVFCDNGEVKWRKAILLTVVDDPGRSLSCANETTVTNCACLFPTCPGWQFSCVAIVLGGSCPGLRFSFMAVILGDSCRKWQLSYVAVVLGGSCRGGNCLSGCSPKNMQQIQQEGTIKVFSSNILCVKWWWV